MEKDIKDRFLRNVKDHKLTVLLDNGIHRHLHFSNPEQFAYYFHLTTWPGYLCISGDMGCYVFCRVEDMFTFFRSDKGNINPHYWSEKLQASKNAPEEFSEETFESRLRHEIDSYWNLSEFLEEVEGDYPEGSEDDEYAEPAPSTWYWRPQKKEKRYHWEPEEKPEARGPFASEEEALQNLKDEIWEDEIQEQIALYDNEHEAYRTALEFKSELTGNDFEGFYEYDCKEYTMHYLWICHAIVWGIQQYDALMQTAEGG